MNEYYIWRKALSADEISQLNKKLIFAIFFNERIHISSKKPIKNKQLLFEFMKDK